MGAVLGTVPDLDVVYPYGDPVSDFVLHRGPSHSLIVHALVTPLFAEPLVRVMRGLRDARVLTYALVFTVFATHALVDAMTVYGTKLLWPLTDHPFGLGSMFIIDPLYSLPLLAVTIWALARGRPLASLQRTTTVALAVTTLYLGWSAVGQSIAEARAEAALAAQGIKAERIIAGPMPFNTTFWRVIAIDDDRYINVYVPLLAGQDAVRVYAHPRGTDLPFCLDAIPMAKTVNTFSKGFVRFKQDGDALLVGDLRMGVTPSFVFDFIVARWDGATFVPVPPEQIRSDRTQDGDIDWLLAGLVGDPGVRAVEAATLLEAGGTRLATAVPAGPAC